MKKDGLLVVCGFGLHTTDKQTAHAQEGRGRVDLRRGKKINSHSLISW